MRKMISVQEPIGDGTKDRGEKNFCLILDDTGMSLYAKAEESVVPDCTFNMGGNQIGAKTLDLNQDFRLICAQLDKIAEDYFGERA